MTSTFYRIMNFNASMLPLLVLLPLVRISEYISMEKDRFFYIALGLYLGLLAISIIFDVIFLCVTFSKKNKSEIFTCMSVQKVKTFSFDYLLSVILPLFVFDVTNVWSFIPLIITLALIGFLYVKNDLCFYNIIMDLLGYNLYEMVLIGNDNLLWQDGKSMLVYAKSHTCPRIEDDMRMLQVGKDLDIFIMKELVERHSDF